MKNLKEQLETIREYLELRLSKAYPNWAKKEMEEMGENLVNNWEPGTIQAWLNSHGVQCTVAFGTYHCQLDQTSPYEYYRARYYKENAKGKSVELRKPIYEYKVTEGRTVGELNYKQHPNGIEGTFVRLQDPSVPTDWAVFNIMSVWQLIRDLKKNESLGRGTYPPPRYLTHKDAHMHGLGSVEDERMNLQTAQALLKVNDTPAARKLVGKFSQRVQEAKRQAGL